MSENVSEERKTLRCSAVRSTETVVVSIAPVTITIDPSVEVQDRDQLTPKELFGIGGLGKGFIAGKPTEEIFNRLEELLSEEASTSVCVGKFLQELTSEEIASFAIKTLFAIAHDVKGNMLVKNEEELTYDGLMSIMEADNSTPRDILKEVDTCKQVFESITEQRNEVTRLKNLEVKLKALLKKLESKDSSSKETEADSDSPSDLTPNSGNGAADAQDGDASQDESPSTTSDAPPTT